MDDLQHPFAADVFGPVAMIRARLPLMRSLRRGHIVKVTSTGGFIAMHGIRSYGGSEFALEEPRSAGQGGRVVRHPRERAGAGRSRISWAGRSTGRTARSVADYDAVMDPMGARRLAESDRQPGDPARAAAALLAPIGAPGSGAHADFNYVLGATHGISSLHARNGDRAALYRDMAWSMYMIARPRPPLKGSS